MDRRDVSFTVALCASLVLHGLLSLALAEIYVRQVGGRIGLPALRTTPETQAEATGQPRFELDSDPRLRLGDTGGTGYAIDESPGERQLLARQGVQDQPFLSRDPVGPGRVGDEPSNWTLPPSDGGDVSAQRALPAPQFASTLDPTPIGIVGQRDRSVIPFAERVEPDDSARPAADPGAQQPVAPAPPIPAASNSSSAAPPGPPTAADPAPKGESELDPVSILGTLDFRSGSTAVRAGRKHRIIRPRLTLDAKLDLVTLGSTMIVLQLQLDAAGNVASARVERSSGSKSVDQIFLVTSYEWWFEPARDDAGRAIDDRFQFVIRIN